MFTCLGLVADAFYTRVRGIQMTPNKRTIEAYMDGFRKTDRSQILSCLTDAVECVIPGAFHARGKDDFARHIVDAGFAGHPAITVSRASSMAHMERGLLAYR